MPNTRTSNFVRRFARPCLVLALAGCASPSAPRVAPTAPTAQLALINQTNYKWRIGFTPADGQAAMRKDVPPKAIVEIPLPAGDYAIEQTIVKTDGTPSSTRNFSTHLEGGQTYRWPLATLLSSADHEDSTDRAKP